MTVAGDPRLGVNKTRQAEKNEKTHDVGDCG